MEDTVLLIYKKFMRRPIWYTLILCIIVFILTPATCIRNTISMKVVDADTGDPIEGALVSILWSETRGVIGLTYSKDIDGEESTSDAKGEFRILRYMFLSYHMAVYKKGYILWQSEFIYPNWERRSDFRMRNNYVIKLSKLPSSLSRKSYNEYEHFVSLMLCVLGGDIDSKVTKDLKELKIIIYNSTIDGKGSEG